MKHTSILIVAAVIFGLTMTQTSSARAASAARIDRDSRSALNRLVNTNAGARNVHRHSRAVLVFPRITKAGFVVAVHRGEGALIDSSSGRTLGYFSTTSASGGLQAGFQRFGQAMFFMNNRELARLNRQGGWELGSAPGIVIADQSISGRLNTTQLRSGVYVFAFNERGLMGGLRLQGSRISRFTPSR